MSWNDPDGYPPVDQQTVSAAGVVVVALIAVVAFLYACWVGLVGHL